MELWYNSSMNSTIKTLVDEINRVKHLMDECWVEGDYVGHGMFESQLERLEAKLEVL